MALGWPVSDSGPAPGLPIWPQARCRLISVAFLAVPLRLWLRPWQYRLSVGRRVPVAGSTLANQRAACRMSASRRPVMRAVSLGVYSRTLAFSASKPLVWAAM